MFVDVAKYFSPDTTGMKEAINPMLGNTEDVEAMMKIKSNSDVFNSKNLCMQDNTSRMKSPKIAAGAQYSQQNVPDKPLSIRYGSSMPIPTEKSIPMKNARFLI